MGITVHMPEVKHPFLLRSFRFRNSFKTTGIGPMYDTYGLPYNQGPVHQIV